MIHQALDLWDISYWEATKYVKGKWPRYGNATSFFLIENS